MSDGDIRQRQRLAVYSLPNINTVYSTSLTITAGMARTFNITVTPTNKELGLWNFLVSVVVDDITKDSGNNFLYLFPSGSAITAAQRQLRLMHWHDWAESNDRTNMRMIKTRIENFDTADHTYYLYFKAYTFDTII